MDGHFEKTTVLTVYSAGVAACYLIGYWGEFDVNIFQHAGLTGFASLALAPLMTVLAINLLLFSIGTVRQPSAAQPLGVSPSATSSDLVGQDASTSVPSSGPLRRIGGRLYRAWIAAVPLMVFLVVGNLPPRLRWAAALLVFIPWIRILSDTPFVSELLPGRYRVHIVYWLVAFPFLSLQQGVNQAESFFDGAEATTVYPTGGAKDVQCDASHPIGYLGFAGGTYFLFEGKTGNVVMLNQAVAGPLTIRRKVEPTLFEWLGSLFSRGHKSAAATRTKPCN